MNKKVEQILNNLNISAPPIPVDKIAEFFSLRIVEYSKFPKHISGTIMQLPDGSMVIGINSNDQKVRQRFSIAHEIAHFLLGHDERHIIDDTFDKPTDKEREANQFAADLLMPIDMLKKDIMERKYDIPSLAKRYDVSDQAMSIRLLEANLIYKIRPPHK